MIFGKQMLGYQNNAGNQIAGIIFAAYLGIDTNCTK